MLQIKDIRKKYVTGDLVQTALDGVSLMLRDNEFVAILGPSGSGKTTLLNVIGGLDRYDSGDLVINGISTKKYTDRDWDSYRNHTIGFVFQSYNLIPHQTVLANVELALTISGISRSERRKRAAKALQDVGLGDQLHKKPNQMSGGQMQRVAIARALVNDPDILLADEPTGALDSETSVQVMELLKEVSRDRLVVMVTHNPELAEDYSNRIVRVKDGRIIGDTNPYEVEPSILEQPRHKNMGKASMSFFTALSLSFNNLKTKKARTLLTAFAGSIGIIGIALILSLSTGFQKYIDQIQEDTLSNYPLTIQTETADMAAAMAAMGSAAQKAESSGKETVVEQPMITQMFGQVGANDLGSFKTHLEENYGEVSSAVNAVQYSYSVKPLIYSADTEKELLQVNPGTVFSQLMGGSPMASYMDSDVFHEMLPNYQMLDSQYEILRGRWPQQENELVFVLADPGRIPDYTAYTLGLKDPKTLQALIADVMNGIVTGFETEEAESWTYDDLLDLKFRLVPAAQTYRYNSEYGVWEDMSDDQAYMRSLVDAGMELSVVGIVCPKEGASATTLTQGLCYLPSLTEKVITDAQASPIVQSQLADEAVDVFTGQVFGAEEENSKLNFQDMISVDGDAITSAFGMNIDENAIASMLENYLKQAVGSMEVDTTPAQAAFTETLGALARDMLSANAGATVSVADAEAMVDAYLSTASAQEKMQAMVDAYQQTAASYQPVLKTLLAGFLTTYIAEEMTYQPVVPDVPTLPEAPTEPVTEPSVPEDTSAATEPPVPDETAASTMETEPSQETTAPVQTEPDTTGETLLPDGDVPMAEAPQIDLSQLKAVIDPERAEAVLQTYLQSPVVSGSAAVMGSVMMESTIQNELMSKLSGFGNVLMGYMGSSFYVDEEKLASAFQFNMDEDQLRRLMAAMSSSGEERSAATNLKKLGYADLNQPTSISVYMVDFAGKEVFLDFLDGYNEKMADLGQEDQVIRYTDLTGIMMSSVRTIIDSVSYVLIAFVAVSLVVSSIMIGIITYISVMERTKEIGVLRAIGASKGNISQVFNAETFIIGLCSGILGVGITLALNFPINSIIHSLTDNPDINAQLPMEGAGILILLSMVLTLIGGLIPSRQAAKKDPVIALRSE